MVGAILDTARVKAKTMRKWDGDMLKNFSNYCEGRVSLDLTRVRCFPVNRGFCLNRTRKDCADPDLVGICFQYDSCMGWEARGGACRPQPSNSTRLASRSTSSKLRRFAPFARPGRRLVIRALRAFPLAAAFSRWSMTAIAPISGETLGKRTKSVTLTKIHGRSSAAATLLSRMF